MDEMAMTMTAIVFEWSSQEVAGEVGEVEVVVLELPEADMALHPGVRSTGSQCQVREWAVSHLCHATQGAFTLGPNLSLIVRTLWTSHCIFLNLFQTMVCQWQFFLPLLIDNDEGKGGNMLASLLYLFLNFVSKASTPHNGTGKCYKEQKLDINSLCLQCVSPACQES